jgi:hypothetical protein
MALQETPKSKELKIKSEIDICQWPFRTITEKQVTTRMDVREISEFQDDFYFVLNCHTSFFRIEIADEFPCPYVERDTHNENMVEKKFFDFSKFYSYKDTYYIMEILGIWLLSLADIIIFGAMPCVSALIDFTDNWLFHYRMNVIDYLDWAYQPEEEFWNIALFDAITFTELGMNGYDCIKGGWANSYKFDTTEWHLLRFSSYLLTNFSIFNPAIWFYVVKFAGQVYLSVIFFM